MPIDIQIPDNDLKGFSPQAQTSLKQAVLDYVDNLIAETNRVEAGRNSTSGAPEVTRGMVNDAKDLLRRGLGVPRKKWGVKIVRVLAAILTLAVGLMYNTAKLQDGTYMVTFIIVISLAILAVTISTLID